MVIRTSKRAAESLGSIAADIADIFTSKWVRVKGESMNPTLRDGQFVRVSRKRYLGSSPQRWDVVLFLHPHRDRFWELKRVVGLPEETVELGVDGLIIDGSATDDSYGRGLLVRTGGSWSLSEDEYLVLGDNRLASTDGRSFGPIKRSSILGMAILPDHRVDEA